MSEEKEEHSELNRGSGISPEVEEHLEESRRLHRLKKEKSIQNKIEDRALSPEVKTEFGGKQADS